MADARSCGLIGTAPPARSAPSLMPNCNAKTTNRTFRKRSSCVRVKSMYRRSMLAWPAAATHMRNFETRYLHKDGHTVSLFWSGVWSEPERRYFFIGRDHDRRAKRPSRLCSKASRWAAALLPMRWIHLSSVRTRRGSRMKIAQAEAILGWSRQEAVGELHYATGTCRRTIIRVISILPRRYAWPAKTHHCRRASASSIGRCQPPTPPRRLPSSMTAQTSSYRARSTAGSSPTKSPDAAQDSECCSHRATPRTPSSITAGSTPASPARPALSKAGSFANDPACVGCAGKDLERPSCNNWAQGRLTQRPSASAINPSEPTITRHQANSAKPWRVT